MALLKRWGFVAEHDGEYGPGPLSVQLAWGFDQSSFLIHEAQPDMAALAVASGETIGLLVAVRTRPSAWTWWKASIRCAARSPRVAACRWPGRVGQVAAGLHAGGAPAGSAGLSGRRGGHGSGAPVRELETIRGQGYAVTDSEVDAGVWGVSVPIFQRAHQAVASITLMAPSTRAAQRPQALIDMTVGAARRISQKLQAR